MWNPFADVPHSFRTLIKSPGFTIVAVLALALGIGANTAIFSVIDRALLRPLPFPDSERIMRLQRHYPEWGRTFRVDSEVHGVEEEPVLPVDGGL